MRTIRNAKDVHDYFMAMQANLFKEFLGYTYNGLRWIPYRTPEEKIRYVCWIVLNPTNKQP